MYLDYFGFTCDPFSISPDPRFLFLSSRHREALAHLVYGTQSSGGFVLLTGEVGTGKTTICRCLLEQLPKKTELVLLWNPRLSVTELLASICDELQIAYPVGTTSVKVFIDAINVFLLDAHSRGFRTIIIIDEAQNLRRDVLEQIRLLTNLETNTHKLLQIILIGQTELQERLNRPELRQLAQRITARYHLLPLSPSDVKGYVGHRLAVAGGRLSVFPLSTISLIYALSGGVPRVINLLCSRSLLGAYAQEKDSVSQDMLRMAAREVFGTLPERLVNKKIVMAGAGLLTFILIGVWLIVGTKLTSSITGSSAGIQHEVPEIAPEVVVPNTPAVVESVLASTEQPESVDEVKERQVMTVAAAGTESLPEQVAVKEMLPPSEIIGTKEDTQIAPAPLDPLEWIKILSEGDKEPEYETIFQSWGLLYPHKKMTSPETVARQNQFILVRQKASFGYLRRLNRPAILRLTDLAGKDFYATLTAIEGDKVVLRKGTLVQKVAISAVLQQWMGDFIVLWQPPPGYRGVLMPGDRGITVNWLARQFAVLNGLEEGGAGKNVYDENLQAQVIAFQASEGLPVDGLAGQMTIMRLSARVASGQPQLENLAVIQKGTGE